MYRQLYPREKRPEYPPEAYARARDILFMLHKSQRWIPTNVLMPIRILALKGNLTRALEELHAAQEEYMGRR